MESVEASLREDGLLPTELEFMAMLKAYRVAEAFDAGFGMLRRMRAEIQCPSEEMCEELRTWFSSVPGWCVADEVSIDDTGAGRAVLAMEEKHVDVQLKAISLTSEELRIYSLASPNSRRTPVSEFNNFTNWLNGKKDGMNVIIDGANVGMYNQNFANSGMNFHQIEKVLVELRKRSRRATRRRWCSYTNDASTADPRENHTIRNSWNDGTRRVNCSPRRTVPTTIGIGSRRALGDDAFLVTNDECRDHVFQMLPAPKLFYRWKERHQVRFSIAAGDVELEYPAKFTTCMQEADDHFRGGCFRKRTTRGSVRAKRNN